MDIQMNVKGDGPGSEHRQQPVADVPVPTGSTDEEGATNALRYLANEYYHVSPVDFAGPSVNRLHQP